MVIRKLSFILTAAAYPPGLAATYLETSHPSNRCFLLHLAHIQVSYQKNLQEGNMFAMEGIP